MGATTAYPAVGASGVSSAPPANNKPQSLDTGLLSLLIVARFHGLPADPEQVRHQFGKAGQPLGETGLLLSARSLGLKASARPSQWARLAVMPLPALAPLRDGRYVVLAKAQADSVLIQDPAQSKPIVLSRESFEQLWTGRLILLAKRGWLGQDARSFDFTWFIPALVKYRALLGEVLLASFFLQLFALVTPLFSQVIIDKVLVHNGMTTLYVMVVGMVALAIFDAVLGGLRTYLFSHTTNRIDVGLGAKLFGHVMALPLAYFETRRVGDTVARVRELETVRQFLTSNAVTVVLDLFFGIVFVAVMLFYSPTLTAIVLAALPLYAVISLAVTPVIRRRLNEKFNRGAENQAFLVEAVTGIQTVKALAIEPTMRRAWEEQLAAYVQASFRATNLINTAGQAAKCIQKLTTIAVLWMGAQLVIKGDLSIGQLVAFNMLSGQVSAPLLRILNLWQEFQQVGISIQRLGDLLNAPAEPSYGQSRTTLAQVKGTVVFDAVHFRYRPDGADILKNISFHVKPGSVIGIVGRSGSGKSTVTKLIQRLYVPASGRVLIDGLDLAQVDPTWLRRQVGVVLQENFLFNKSARDNIAMAQPGASMDEVVEAAKLAGAHEFILELPEGYDTVVGERGCSLSGGQRQRIAIARALVPNPRILILDEATSALDYESESIIQQNLAKICKGRTVFIIAHRLSTVRPAHAIFVIEKGEVVEQGAHDELLKRNGYYARLHRHQQSGVVVA